MKLKSKSVQDFIPIRRINHGIIETTDNRYIKILEIEPINFMLRSSEEQASIISSFASWLKISPIKMQFKSVTRRADSDKYIALLREDIEREDNRDNSWDSRFWEDPFVKRSSIIAKL